MKTYVHFRGRAGTGEITTVLVCSSEAIAQREYRRQKANPRAFYVHLSQRYPQIRRNQTYLVMEVES